MDLTPFIVFGLIAIIIGLQLILRRQALRSKGHSAAPLVETLPELNTKATSLVYCYSPNCGPCKAMQPAIDELARNNPNIHSLNILEHLDLAREMGIRATPTTLLIKQETIAKVMLGGKSLKSLQKLLEQEQ